MASVVRIVNGIISVLGIFTGLLAFLLSGLMASFFPTMVALVAFLPFVILIISLIGLYGVVKDSWKVQLAFDICLLPAWYVGTVIGGLCLVLFGIDYYQQKKTSAPVEE